MLGGDRRNPLFSNSVFNLTPFRAIGTRLRNWRKWRLYILVVTLAYILTLVFGTLLAPLRGNLENLVFDQYQRWGPRPYAFDQPVKIVDIDDESIARIGRWPWPRATMASLVDALAKANVAAIGFDVLFSEKDQPSQAQAACADQPAHSADQAAHCEEPADGDVAFAHAITGRPVVLGTFFTTTPTAAKTRLVPKGSLSFIGETPTSESPQGGSASVTSKVRRISLDLAHRCLACLGRRRGVPLQRRGSVLYSQAYPCRASASGCCRHAPQS